MGKEDSFYPVSYVIIKIQCCECAWPGICYNMISLIFQSLVFFLSLLLEEVKKKTSFYGCIRPFFKHFLFHFSFLRKF